MGDPRAALGSMLEVLGPVVKPALRALVRTTAGVLALGVVATGAAVWIAANGSLVRGLLAAALCTATGAVVAGVLGVKNAIFAGLLAGVEKLALGRSVTWLVFRELGVRDGEGQTAGDGVMVRVAERVPLGEAEARLRRAVESVLGARAAKSGVRAWMARKLLAALLERVERLTLARFRTAEAAHGGVDLRLVRDELGAGIDGLVASGIGRQATVFTAFVAGGYALSALLIGYGVSALQL
jgi:hypothetical protein